MFCGERIGLPRMLTKLVGFRDTHKREALEEEALEKEALGKKRRQPTSAASKNASIAMIRTATRIRLQ